MTDIYTLGRAMREAQRAFRDAVSIKDIFKTCNAMHTAEAAFDKALNEQTKEKSMSNAIHPAPTEFSQMQLSDDPILRFFHYAHLPPALQDRSKPFCDLARHIVETTPRNAERTVALRKLLEAKDCAVRAGL